MELKPQAQPRPYICVSKMFGNGSKKFDDAWVQNKTGAQKTDTDIVHSSSPSENPASALENPAKKPKVGDSRPETRSGNRKTQ
ncbi:unnamed protein product [Miscanthus lutarioriparius]|uniref:Uncharacterized protein n=1 Tax=Miscanthus lutarioriparius TaxID=422564 RepID=A0A811QNF8_9POAL|nr:unnamed protein product [Miscanthus lutarioriparius]